LPQQLRPAHEGLKAYVDLVNASGGVCGRKVILEYRNDNLNVQQHISDYQSLAGQVFAFVANESLLESSDYDQSPPFEPRFTDDGDPVPDVGGLAFSYGRSQSSWHAGVIGSLSPVLVGGGQFRYFAGEAKAAGRPCRKGALVYLREPTGASEDQARLGEVAVRESWGAGLGQGNTALYAANLQDPVPVYQALVQQMIADGMNCAFSYADLGSNVNLVRAMANEGVWPPSRCTRGDACFRIVYVPLAAYDARFIQDAGDAASDVRTFIPHLPVNETGHAAMKTYLAALRTSFPDATPSTFSIIGFTSGQMFVEALQSCGAAPTRACVMMHLRALKDFTSGGMLGGTTPFRTTKVTFGNFGTLNWKHIFNHTIALQVTERNGKVDFYRTRPDSGFFKDTVRVARGTAG